MARLINRLNQRKCATLSKPGLHADGGGLYLKVGTTAASRSWIFRYRRNSKLHDVGLGSFIDYTLIEARERARDQRRLCNDGIDPVAEKRLIKQQRKAARTFRQCAEEHLADIKAGWRNPKYEKDWANSLSTYAYPIIGDMPVGEVDLASVLRVIKPRWESKTVTMERVRSRIEAVLAYATVHGLRSGDNPARWDNHIDKLLPKKSKVAKKEHFAALPYAELPAFMAELRAKDDGSITAAALEFTLLTAGRSGEVLGARWEEFDLKAGLWTIPGVRMKAERDHRVALSRDAVVVVERMAAVRQNDFVFPGRRGAGQMHERNMLDMLKRLRPGCTVHGTSRSGFTDWCAEQTNYPKEVRDMALAHRVSDEVEAAYRRGDLFAKRRALSEQWARFLASGTANVTRMPLRRA
jgi:integrase